jgi:hypothetical protein
MHHFNHFPLRRPSVDSIMSNWSSHSHQNDDNEDDHAKPSDVVNVSFRARQPSTCSERSCEAMSPDETRDLWRCMLELQERYGCYNSTRIDLALGAGVEGVDLMPNRFIIDTLNNSVVDLPEEGWQMLNRYLGTSRASTPKKEKRQFWNRG